MRAQINRSAWTQSILLRRSLLACLAVFAVIRIITYIDFVKEPFVRANDLTWDYASAKEWRNGGNPYSLLVPLFDKYVGPNREYENERYVDRSQRNPHPPAYVIFTVPLTFFGVVSARVIWFLAMLAAAFAAIYIFARGHGVTPERSALLGLCALAVPVISQDTRWAQINCLLLLALVVAWNDLRRGNDRRAGFILGVTAALKIFPFLMIIPLIRMAHRRAALWMTVTAGVVSVGAIAIVGVSYFPDYLDALSGNQKIWGSAPYSISLVSAPLRWLVPGRWLHSSEPVPMSVVLLSLAILGLCVVALVRTRGSWTRDLYWASVPWIILASPIAWSANLVLLIPLGVILWRNRASMSIARRTALGTGFAIVMLGDTFAVYFLLVLGLEAGRLALQLFAMSLIMGSMLLLALTDAVRSHEGSHRRGSRALLDSA